MARHLRAGQDSWERKNNMSPLNPARGRGSKPVKPKAITDEKLGRLYILDDDHRPVAVRDIAEWIEWYTRNPGASRIAETFTRYHHVSTIFLGASNPSFVRGRPVLFETIISGRKLEVVELDSRGFSLNLEGDRRRYASWEKAVSGHNTIVRRCRKLEAVALSASD